MGHKLAYEALRPWKGGDLRGSGAPLRARYTGNLKVAEGSSVSSLKPILHLQALVGILFIECPADDHPSYFTRPCSYLI